MNYCLKLFTALNVIFKSKRSFFSFFRRGASIASTQILHNISLNVPEIATIFDVGANQGQFAIASNIYYPKATIYSFEPVPDIFRNLERNTKNINNIHCINYALGATEGEIDFYSNNHSHASSALIVSDFQKAVIPETLKTKQIKVDVNTLDKITTTLNIQSPILLKMDVQGFEKKVLEGAINFINKVDYLLFEASFISMYDGEALFEEMHTIVKDLGFELIAPTGFLQSKNLQVLQMDMLYKKSKK